MRWAMLGLAALAVAEVGMAQASLTDSDLWIGFQDSENGFLLDEATGSVWMTGECLKALSRAEQDGSIWTSHTIELVSVGRAVALLDQRFQLDLADDAAITVTSNGRGGAQRFSAVVDRDCQSGGLCGHLIRTQKACED